MIYILKNILIIYSNFIERTDEENKNRIKLFFLDSDYYKEIYTKIAQIYYYGVAGIVEKDYKKSLNIFNYLFKNNDVLYGDERFSLQYIYYINRNIRKKIKYSGLMLKNPPIPLSSSLAGVPT